MSSTCISEQQRLLIASSIYSQPLKPWETRVVRLEPANNCETDRAGIVELRLETAVIPHLDGLGLVDTGEVVFYEALSYTWDSNVFSHAIKCNGFDFSVTSNLHAALMHLKPSHGCRWLWIDALCINQYDNTEKECQVRNMFHIYRKASTVLVWLGSAGPGTSLAAGIVNIYDRLWQEVRQCNFFNAVRQTLMARICDDSDAKVLVNEFLSDLQESEPSEDRSGPHALELLSTAFDGIIDILGRPWLKRTWIIQELAAASKVQFHCGQSVISYDGFFFVMREVGMMIWGVRNTYLAGEEDAVYTERLQSNRRHLCVEFETNLFVGHEVADNEAADFFRESAAYTDVLHEMRQLVNDPTRHVQSRTTQTELLLKFLMGIMSRGFEVSIAIDKVYSLIAMADAISSASWGLTFNTRIPSSPQALPVDYSVCFRDAVLCALKIRMNEIGYFYVAISCLLDEGVDNADQKTKSVLFSKCLIDSSIPSWLRLLEFNQKRWGHYNSRIGTEQKIRGFSPRKSWIWVDQDIKDPDTLELRGKALGRLVVDSQDKEHPSRAWVELPCPLGQEFESSYDKYQKPVRALHQGCPDEGPEAANGASLDDALAEPIGQETAFNQSGRETDSDYDEPVEITWWSWRFPPTARNGDIVVVFNDTCTLLRPLDGGKYYVVENDLRVPMDSTKRLSNGLENDFLAEHCEDLDTFILI